MSEEKMTSERIREIRHVYITAMDAGFHVQNRATWTMIGELLAEVERLQLHPCYCVDLDDQAGICDHCLVEEMEEAEIRLETEKIKAYYAGIGATRGFGNGV
jgi:hypothetical protein